MQNFNSITKMPFSESNQELLEQHKMTFELTSNEWAGFKQWIDSGRVVKKGAKGCKIWLICDKKIEKSNDKKTEESTKRKVCKSRYVFNREHTDEM